MIDCKTSNNVEEQPTPIADYKIEDWLAFILFWALAITVFSQFISRYLLSSPLGWTEELARYQLVCLGFLGSCIGIRNNSHIFVILFHRWIPITWSKWLFKIIAIGNLLMLILLAYFAWQIIPLIHIHKMASIDVPVSVLYGAILGSLVIMVLRSGQQVIQRFSSKPSSTNHFE